MNDCGWVVLLGEENDGEGRDVHQEAGREMLNWARGRTWIASDCLILYITIRWVGSVGKKWYSGLV